VFDPRIDNNVLSGLALDRMAENRLDEAWLAGRLNHPSTRIVLLQRGRTLVRDGDPQASLALLRPEEWSSMALKSEYCAFLGVEKQAAVFAISVEEDQARQVTQQTGHRFQGLRSVIPQLSTEEAGLAAYARALNLWQANHRFCGRCGSATQVDTGGFRMQCTDSACGMEQFPRLDPAVIVIIGYQGRCLLGRQSNWPKGVYSTLAGFVEPGESLEDAVIREVMEESGVELARMAYHSSQPWPFPSSLMLGFVAEAASATIKLGDELEEVRWFDLEELEQGVLSRKLMLSSPASISHRLIADWLRSEHKVDLAQWRAASQG
jgi:NAD+ diphosphatase